MNARTLILALTLATFWSPSGFAQTPAKSNAPANSAGPASQLSSADAAKLQKKAEDFLRNLYAWGPEYEVKAAEPKAAPVEGLYEMNVAVSLQGQSDSALVYVSKDGRYMFRGEISDMNADPFAEVRSKLNLADAPSRGPTDAKYVMVEFGDFQCPSCRQLEYILRDILANNKQVRLVFKDFPLESIHPWAMTAALVGRCAFQQNPDGFWKLHDAIYDNQEKITTEGALDKLIQMGTEAGLDASSLRSCVANPKTTEIVRQSIVEGANLGVEGTPTTFVNGRTVVGPNEPLITRILNF
jgi:protein-disulfide isomerase